jgi:hypothetical protein
MKGIEVTGKLFVSFFISCRYGPIICVQNFKSFPHSQGLSRIMIFTVQNGPNLNDFNYKAQQKIVFQFYSEHISLNYLLHISIVIGPINPCKNVKINVFCRDVIQSPDIRTFGLRFGVRSRFSVPDVRIKYFRILRKCEKYMNMR